MAEGDSIRRLADRLTAAVAGATVTRSVVRHPRWATTSLTGMTIDEVDAVGKHLLMRLSPTGTGTPVTVHSHLRMSGRWTVGVPPRTPVHRRRVELHLDDRRVLVGIDLPVLHIGRSAAEARWVGHLGPDLCGRAFDGPEAVRRLRATGTAPVAAGLLDQRRLAGIGNLYAVELPFLCGVSPWTPVATLTGLDHLVALARALLCANVTGGQQTTTGRTHRRRRHWIYGRTRQPCHVCAAPLRNDEQPPWHRPTWWCPACQSGTTVDAARSRRLLREHRSALDALAALPAVPLSQGVRR